MKQRKTPDEQIKDFGKKGSYLEGYMKRHPIPKKPFKLWQIALMALLSIGLISVCLIPPIIVYILFKTFM